MDEILPDIDKDQDVIFGEYRDRQVVNLSCKPSEMPVLLALYISATPF